MEIFKEWFLLLPLTSTQWDSLIELIALIKTTLMAVETVHLLSWPLGTTCTHMGINSTQIEIPHIMTNTIPNKNSLFSSGRCMTPNWSSQKASSQPNTNHKCLSSISMNSIMTIDAGVAAGIIKERQEKEYTIDNLFNLITYFVFCRFTIYFINLCIFKTVKNNQ